MSTRKSERNITAKIASVACAVVLWFSVTTNSVFNYKTSLPIQYIAPSEGYMIASSKPDDITVVLGGTGRDLVMYYLFNLIRSREAYTLVNLTGLPEGKNKISIGDSTIYLGLVTGLEIVKILSPDNATFPIEIDKVKKRTVAVDTGIIYGYKVKDGYCLTGKPVVKPEFVIIDGPEDVINDINSVKMTPFEGQTVSLKDTVLTSRLVIPQFVTVEPPEVSVYFPVEPLMQKKLTGIPVELEEFPHSVHPVFYPDSMTVQIEGPKSLVSRVESDNIILAIHYGAFKEAIARGDSVITPLPSFPAGISIVNIIPKELKFKMTR